MIVRSARKRWGCCAFDRVQSFSEWLRGTMEETGRDASHGMEHFERVRQISLQLAEESWFMTSEEQLLLQLAALSHDYLDHKYVTEQQYEGMKRELFEALRNVACLEESQVLDVFLVSQNVSLSKELDGRLEEELLKRRGLMDIRNCVSDADKIEALGKRGLLRLGEYQRALNGAECLTASYLRDLANKHLLHRYSYLRTAAGIQMGKQPYMELLEILACDELLEGVAEEVVAGGHADRAAPLAC